MAHLAALQSENVFIAVSSIVCLDCGEICKVAFPVLDAGFTERQRIFEEQDGHVDVSLPFVALVHDMHQIMPESLLTALRANSTRFALTTRGYRHVCPSCSEIHDEKRILSPYADGTINELNAENVQVYYVSDDALVISSYQEANWLYNKLLEA